MKKFMLTFLILTIYSFAGEKILNSYWFQEGEKQNIEKILIDKNSKNYIDPYWFQEENKDKKQNIKKQIN